jgi:hypothetical protein
MAFETSQNNPAHPASLVPIGIRTARQNLTNKLKSVQVYVLGVERHLLYEDSSVQVDRVAQTDTVIDGTTVNEHGQTGPDMSLAVEDVSSRLPEFLKVTIQYFADGIAKSLHWRTAYEVLNERTKDDGCHHVPPLMLMVPSLCGRG